MKNKIYIIDGKTYLSHINDEVHLYGLLHQLAFLAGRIKDEEDVFHVLDAAKRYGEIAEEKFQSWGIPGRYLVFGDPKDLKGLMDKELDEVEAVPEEEPKPKKYRDEYIIPGSGFRMLVGDIHHLIVLLGLPESSGIAHDTLEEAIIKRHNLIPLEEVEDEPQDDGLEGDEVWSD